MSPDSASPQPLDSRLRGNDGGGACLEARLGLWPENRKTLVPWLGSFKVIAQA